VAIAVEIASIVTPLEPCYDFIGNDQPHRQAKRPSGSMVSQAAGNAMIQVKPKRVRISPDDDSVGKKRSRDERNAAVADDECFDNVQKSV
jgi:hypothetical protein